MSAITFTNHGGDAYYARFTGADLPGGVSVMLQAVKVDGCVTLSLNSGVCDAAMHFTPDQARAVAAELLACADALQGGAA